MKKYAYPSLNRRDLIKVGLFAGASLSLSLPMSQAVAGRSASADGMPASKLSKSSRPR